jgi:hypothetical protein
VGVEEQRERQKESEQRMYESLWMFDPRELVLRGDNASAAGIATDTYPRRQKVGSVDTSTGSTYGVGFSSRAKSTRFAL